MADDNTPSASDAIPSPADIEGRVSQDAVPKGEAPRPSISSVKFSLLRWWRQEVTGTVDQPAVIEKRRDECALSERYLFMTAMSGGIAILGLLLSSPAVVIGAMLLSPLMGPIMGLGFALAIGDYRWLKQSARSLAWGSAMAILLCALIVFFSPIQTITPEIAARTRPNLFDLLVALFSALAGAYAMIRGREGTIVGVAIATALMPPLAVVGYGAATLNWTVFSGALLLYVTNLLTIAITAWGMARLYGFRTILSERNTLFQNLAIVSVVIALAIPLFISLQNIAWETNAQRIVRNELQDAFGPSARIDQFDIDFANDPMVVDATVLTPRLQDDADAEISAALERRLGQSVELLLTQFQVGTSASAAEQAQLSAAREREEANAREQAEDLAKRLALVAGVTEDDVLVDRSRKRALVRALDLEGATLATYNVLEARIAATEPDWTVELLPPAKPLPSITFRRGRDEEGMPTIALTEQGEVSRDLAIWSARRLGFPLVVSGPLDLVERIEAELADAGIERVQRGLITRNGSEVTLRWGDVD
ncbi:TIGR00341 family protein [Altererythrobacter lutimaris]|uniref:TIGR00341 family protein n=1 Tax=Altererythrobacter lutimaris TaxID=2743979 RepID=A0A850HE03_9SPHN|nr:TIGR00341 family protein [Altererythrobacter lutimaris]NVE95675.1 TIGR00341 family protein [Altererythrobacter lutimaris]